MKEENNHNNSRTKIISIVVGFFILLFSNGRWTVPIGPWLAPIFILYFTRQAKKSWHVLLLFPIFCVAAYIMLYGIIPPSIGMLSIGLSVYYALLWFMPYFLDRIIYNRLKVNLALLVFPSAYVSLEYVNAITLGSWSSVAYTQYGNQALIQLVSITGIYGITFIITWFSSLLAGYLLNQKERQSLKFSLFVFTGMLVTILFYGGVRLLLLDPVGDTVRVAAFTSSNSLASYAANLSEAGVSSSIEMAEQDRTKLKEFLNQYHDSLFTKSEFEFRDGSQIVIWPEGGVKVLMECEQDFINKGKAISEKYNGYLLMAYFVIREDTPSRNGENKAVLVGPGGQLLWSYIKTYPVPGSPDLPGNGILPIAETKFGVLSTAVCYDMDFPNLTNQTLDKNIDIILVPAWDWQEIDPLHARMASFRAIESGFSMVRETGEGLSLAVDYLGNVLAKVDYFQSPGKTMIAEVPVAGTVTSYAIIKDTFAWSNILLFIALTLFSSRSFQKS